MDVALVFRSVRSNAYLSTRIRKVSSTLVLILILVSIVDFARRYARRRTSLFNFLKIDPDKMILGNFKREYTQINETKKLLQDAAIRYLQDSLK